MGKEKTWTSTAVSHPLMITRNMIMGHVFLDDVLERGFAQEDHPVEAFLLR